MRTAAERKMEAARAQQITEELVQARKEWCLRVYKRDRRYAAGQREVNKYYYKDMTAEQMAAEVSSLRTHLYRLADGWRLEYSPAWVEVRNIMNGQKVTIAADMQGTCCDPSTETFWSM